MLPTGNIDGWQDDDRRGYCRLNAMMRLFLLKSVVLTLGNGDGRIGGEQSSSEGKDHVENDTKQYEGI